MMNTYLLLWLEAPLQSWGVDSKFDRRDTLNFPTKSGILGLLLCALGASGEQKELLKQFASLRLTIVSYARTRKLKNNTVMAVTREVLLRDFHMVGSGYNEKNPWETLMIPKKSDGGKAVGGGTKLTYRYYLQDARFSVILEVPETLAQTCADKLKNPEYDLYLGRKNCVPTDFIYRGTFSSEQEAFNSAKLIADEKILREEFRVIEGAGDGEVLTINDIPMQFGLNKKYRDRQVTVVQHE
ncbi:MAG: type I-E CRISPR-associated protein Cas5/CasD [PVC group bacterium]|nr:type I-E CRISPR-associated protein Cas5/CasD [PVC group bacterium]